MKGKITVRTRFKFVALNKKKDFREFLQGEWSGRKHTRVRLLLLAGLYYSTSSRILSKHEVFVPADWRLVRRLERSLVKGFPTIPS
jgi:hypothetical protein